MKEDKILSPDQRAIKRLLKNKPAVFGIVLITLASLVALFGYWIAPDSSPNANEQIAEVALKDPGFNIQLLKVRKNRKIEESHFFETLAFGRTNAFKFVPINNYTFRTDSIEVELYMGEDIETGQLLKGKQQKFHLADVVFPIRANQKIEHKNGNRTGRSHVDVGKIQVGS